MRHEDVGAVEDQAPWTVRRVVVGGTAVALVRTDAGYSAFEDRCPHAGAPLTEGVLRDGHLVCAWHGWRFDAATGACPLYAGAPSAACLDVRVEGGRVCVALRG